MIVFPNCKINLGLHVVSKREDGYHNLETIFYPLPVRDALEITRSEAGSQRSKDGSQRPEDGSQGSEDGSQRPEDGSQKSEAGSQRSEDGSQKSEAGSQRSEAGSQKSEVGSQKSEVGSQRSEAGSQKSEAGSQRPEAGSQRPEERQPATIHLSGLPVQGKTEDNLCIKAYHLLKKDHPQLSDVDIYLHKAIPMGAGLGGGSADGAFALTLLNDKFQLNIPREKLLEYSRQLGSDCPFFIINKPCFATGRGELLQNIQLDLSIYSFLVVHPGVHISTSWAFSQLTPAPSSQPLQDIIQQPITHWRTALKNDFETPVFKHHPNLQAIKDRLYENGALYASMTGSGSCFFGIYLKEQLPALRWPANYAVFNLK